MTDSHKFELTVPLPPMVGANFLHNLQEIYWRVSFGLNKANLAETPPNLLDLPLSQLQISPASDLSRSPEEVRDNFCAWLVANGLRDCAESFHTYLDDVFKACNAVDSLRFDLSDAHVREQRLTVPEAQFHRENFPNKLRILESRFGVSFRADLLTYVGSLNRARNCLAHRRGRIGAANLDRNGEFVLEWGRWAFVGMKPGLNRIIDANITMPFALQENEGLGIQFVVERRVYKLDEMIEVSTSDFAGFIATYLTLVTAGAAQIKAFYQTKLQNVPVKNASI